MIPYGRQSISEEDVAAVVEVLRSDFLTQGPCVPRFEEELARYCGVPHVVAMNSATSVLHLACLALGLGPGDWLWTSPNTFVASANCARYCGASVDFVDIDPTTFNLSLTALADKLEKAEQAGRLPKILVPVHFSGQPCDMRGIAALAKRYGFRVIEDASHAVGADYLGEKVGNCRHSDITVFSFHPVKIITTGEGGVALTRNSELARRMASLRSHGITRDSTEMVAPAPGSWYYEQLELGYNFRMTDMQAALGCNQLKRLDEFLIRRRELVVRYNRLLAGLTVSLPLQSADVRSSWHLYVVGIDARDRVFQSCREAGVGVNVHYIPVHLQPYYARLGFKAGDYPQAERYYERAMSLPLYAGMSDQQQDEVVRVLGRALRS